MFDYPLIIPFVFYTFYFGNFYLFDFLVFKVSITKIVLVFRQVNDLLMGPKSVFGIFCQYYSFFELLRPLVVVLWFCMIIMAERVTMILWLWFTCLRMRFFRFFLIYILLLFIHSCVTCCFVKNYFRLCFLNWMKLNS
jgi:hypothetical protein